MVKIFGMILATILLAGCTAESVTKESIEARAEAPEVITTRRFIVLVNFP